VRPAECLVVDHAPEVLISQPSRGALKALPLDAVFVDECGMCRLIRIR